MKENRETPGGSELHRSDLSVVVTVRYKGSELRRSDLVQLESTSLVSEGHPCGVTVRYATDYYRQDIPTGLPGRRFY